MILPNGLPEDVFGSGLINLAGEESVARIFLTDTDVLQAEAILAGETPAPIVSPFDYFENGYFTPNLLINRIAYSPVEKYKLAPNIGDDFSIYFFGKSPISLQVNAVLLNTYGDTHKAGMISAYQHILRLSRVTELDITPHLSYLGNIVQGAMLNMDFVEQGANEGVIQVTFDWLVFNAVFSSSRSYTAEDGSIVQEIVNFFSGFC